MQVMDERKESLPEKEIFEQFYDLNSVASATGFTGMTPSLPLSEDELESYASIHGMPKKQMTNLPKDDLQY